MVILCCVLIWSHQDTESHGVSSVSIRSRGTTGGVLASGLVRDGISRICGDPLVRWACRCGSYFLPMIFGSCMFPTAIGGVVHGGQNFLSRVQGLGGWSRVGERVVMVGSLGLTHTTPGTLLFAGCIVPSAGRRWPAFRHGRRANMRQNESAPDFWKKGGARRNKSWTKVWCDRRR